MFPSRFRWTIKGKEEKGGNTQDGWEKCTHAKYDSSKIDLKFCSTDSLSPYEDPFHRMGMNKHSS